MYQQPRLWRSKSCSLYTPPRGLQCGLYTWSCMVSWAQDDLDAHKDRRWPESSAAGQENARVSAQASERPWPLCCTAASMHACVCRSQAAHVYIRRIIPGFAPLSRRGKTRRSVHAARGCCLPPRRWVLHASLNHAAHSAALLSAWRGSLLAFPASETAHAVFGELTQLYTGLAWCRALPRTLSTRNRGKKARMMRTSYQGWRKKEGMLLRRRRVMRRTSTLPMKSVLGGSADAPPGRCVLT